jgi:hypothetical protein
MIEDDEVLPSVETAMASVLQVLNSQDFLLSKACCPLLEPTQYPYAFASALDCAAGCELFISERVAGPGSGLMTGGGVGTGGEGGEGTGAGADAFGVESPPSPQPASAATMSDTHETERDLEIIAL